MDIIEIFESFAADFEAALEDDNWLRLKKYFTEDATYLNVGVPDSKSVGPDAIITFFKKDVTDTDRKFDTRKVVALSSPTTDGNRLSRRWCATYKLSGVPDLVIEGESRYLVEGDLIKEIEAELTEDSMKTHVEWMSKYGDKLQARN